MALIENRYIQSRPQAAPGAAGAGRLANGLGWFGIGLGAAQVLAPQKIAQMAGIHDGAVVRAFVRACGLRQVVTGIGILSLQSPVAMWGRVAGDVMDFASLGILMGSETSNRGRVAAASAMVLGVTAVDAYCSRQLTRASVGDGRIRMTKTIIINRPLEEVFSFWREFEKFPHFIDQLMSVRRTGERYSHWRMIGPAGKPLEWDTEFDIDRQQSLIAWRSTEGTDIKTAGTVQFQNAAGGRGTLVKIDFEYIAPAGRYGAMAAKLFGLEPGQLVESALRRSKQILETGDIVRSDASIHPGMHPALPPSGRKRESFPAPRGHTAAMPREASVPS